MAKKGDLVAALAAALEEMGIGIPNADQVLARAYEIAGTDKCFVKAADDEPLFVLRAKDRCAPGAVRDWATRARNLGSPDAKVTEAMDLAAGMDAYARTHTAKVPD